MHKTRARIYSETYRNKTQKEVCGMQKIKSAVNKLISDFFLMYSNNDLTYIKKRNMHTFMRKCVFYD